MNIMTKQEKELNVYELTYPCFVAGIPKESNRIIHIPGKFEYKDLDQSYDYILEGYKTKDKIYLFDCMTVKLWYGGTCNREYYKRLRDLRAIISSDLAIYSRVQDLAATECYTPIDVKEAVSKLDKSKFDKIQIMNSNGYYLFGPSQDGELVEIDINEKTFQQRTS